MKKKICLLITTLSLLNAPVDASDQFTDPEGAIYLKPSSTSQNAPLNADEDTWINSIYKTGTDFIDFTIEHPRKCILFGSIYMLQFYIMSNFLTTQFCDRGELDFAACKSYCINNKTGRY